MNLVVQLLMLLVLQEAPDTAPKSLKILNQTALPLGNRIALESPIMQEARSITVVLPEPYESSKAAFPVLLLLGGEDHLQTVAAHAASLAKAGFIPHFIVVAVETREPFRDLTPTPLKAYPDSGGGGLFLSFLQKEVLPLVEGSYRTHPYRILAGHGIGGTFCLFAMTEAPQWFNHVLVASPALWWDGGHIADHFAPFVEKHRQAPIGAYLSMGELGGGQMLNLARKLSKQIQEIQTDGFQFHYREFADESHLSTLSPCIYYGLKQVHAGMHIPKDMWEQFNVAGFTAHEQKLMRHYGASVRQTPETYASLGLFLMEKRDFEGAIAVFARLADAYPEYPDSFAKLGDAWSKQGNHQEALRHYRKAFDLARALKLGQTYIYQLKIQALSEKMEQ